MKESFEDVLDESLFQPLLLSSIEEGEGVILKSIFAKPDWERMKELADRLRPIKLGCFVFGSLAALLAAKRLGCGDLVHAITTGVVAHDLLRVSSRAYLKSYAVQLARHKFPDMLTSVGHAIGQVVSFFGLPVRQDDYFRALYGPLNMDVLTDQCFCKTLWIYLVKNNIIESKKQR